LSPKLELASSAMSIAALSEPPIAALMCATKLA
jgi:hypothetical protein